MLDPDVQALFAPGASLIVGAVTDDGEPAATRAFALVPVDPAWARIRVVVGLHDPAAVAMLVVGAEVAVTGADVRTLRSAQIKGPIVAVRPAVEADLADRDEATDLFIGAIHETDGTAVELVWRFVPADYVVIEVERREHYDQSPGPGAGAALTR